MRVRHDLSAGNGCRAWLEAERLQIHPEMLLLESGDRSRAHPRGRHGGCEERKRKPRGLGGPSRSLPTVSLRSRRSFHCQSLLLSRPEPFRLKGTYILRETELLTVVRAQLPQQSHHKPRLPPLRKSSMRLRRQSSEGGGTSRKDYISRHAMRPSLLPSGHAQPRNYKTHAALRGQRIVLRLRNGYLAQILGSSGFSDCWCVGFICLCMLVVTSHKSHKWSTVPRCREKKHWFHPPLCSL